MELVSQLLFVILVSSILIWSVLRRRRAVAIAEIYLSEAEEHLRYGRYREAEDALDKIPLPPAVWFAISERYLRVSRELDDRRYQARRHSR